MDDILLMKITAIKSKLACWLLLTLICFIQKRMISTLKFVMNHSALLIIKKSIYCLVTIAHLIDIVEKLMIKIRISSSVGFIMKIEACLRIMFGLLVTLMYFKILQKLFKKLVIFFGILFEFFYLPGVIYSRTIWFRLHMFALKTNNKYYQ